MKRSMWCAMALALAMAPAQAQDTELQKLREELRALQQRIQALEKKLGETQAAEAPAPQAPAGQSRQSAFNPAISLILQGTFARSTQDPDRYQITGFAPSGGEVAPARRGFSLAESELIVSANVDPYFRGQLVAALTPDNSLEVEEAFVQTLGLGHGFTIKGGRFLSGIGYQNQIHRHAWDFQDAPLAYKAFLGGRLNDDGVQLTWVAPTDLLVELGAELGRGRSFPGSDRAKNGVGAWSLFGHLGGDIGSSTAWRAGLSYLQTSPRNRAFNDLDSRLDPSNMVVQSFSGRSRMWVADFVLKWAPQGNASRTNFKLQGEYFRRRESGALTWDDTGLAAAGAPQFNAAFTDGFSSTQSGWYLQGVYQFMPRWRGGYRHDRLSFGTVGNGIVANGLGPTAADFPTLMSAHRPSRNSMMVDFSPSEFSRFRVQFAADKSRIGVTDHQLVFQYIHSLGAHGGHRF